MSYPVKSFSSLSSCVKEEAAMVLDSKRQGIVSILGSDSDQRITRTAASLRRTLSADMSSKNWQIQNGLKKTASTQTFQTLLPTSPDSSSIFSSSSSSSSSDGEEEQQPAPLDIWTAITSKQEDNKNDVPAPYIHPLVKTSSSLSEKSLEICTESLGSETGSDCFSSYPASEAGSDAEEGEKEAEEETEQETEHPKNIHHQEEDRVEENNFLASSGCKKLAQRSLPPPISSLSSQNGVSLQMRSRRDNGRLVLEAVSVPPQNNFLAQRQDGRLVLSLINTRDEGHEVVENEVDQFAVDFENSCDEIEDVEEETEEVEEEKVRGGEQEVRFVMEEAPKLGGGLISLHRLAMGMNKKSMVLTNRNPVVWPNRFYENDKFENDRDETEEDDEVEVVVGPKISPITQSLPPRPKVAVGRMIPSAAMALAAPPVTASFNAYEYFWKTKPISTTTTTNKAAQVLGTNHNNNNNKQFLSKNSMPNESQGKSIARGGEYKLGPLGTGCKEARRRSLLFWEPPCITTS